TLYISGTILDDTLYHGTDIRLFIDGDEVGKKYISIKDSDAEEFDESKPYKLPDVYKGAFEFKKAQYQYQYKVAENSVGDDIHIRLQAKDSNGVLIKTNEISVAVIADQPPGVSVVAPVPSQYITEGEKVRFEAV